MKKNEAKTQHNIHRASYISMRVCPLWTRKTCLIGYIVLAHWQNSLWVNMLLHSDTSSQFRINQPLLLPLSVLWRSSKYQFQSFVWPSRSRNHDLQPSKLTITLLMRFILLHKCHDMMKFPSLEKPVFHRTGQRRYNRKCHWASDNEKQVPY